MKLLSIILVLFSSTLYGQVWHINGVIQTETGEAVPYALITDSLHRKAVYADIEGNFQLVTEHKINNLNFSHVSYCAVKLDLSIKKDTFIIVRLPNLKIKEILVKGTSLSRQATLGVNFLDRRTIQNIPSFFGEPDLVKAATVLPGVAPGLDIYSGIYVRGGNRDQNLFLVDGAHYYTTSHAGGLLSLFNADMVQHVDIYKGIAPAKFGGAVSSVVDVKYREGGYSPHFNVDIGTLRSGFFMETNGNKKLYFALAGRLSYLELITGNAFKKMNYQTVPDDSASEDYSKFNFWDIDSKLLYKPSPRTAISINLHLGKDEIASYITGSGYIANVKNVTINEGRGTYITNNNITLNFRHLFDGGLTFKNTLYFTNYLLSDKHREETFSSRDHYSSYRFEESTFVKDLSNKANFTYQVNEKQVLSFGLQTSYYTVNPQYGYEFNDLEGFDSTFGYQNEMAFETAGFINDNINLTNKILLKAGLRISGLTSTDTTFIRIEPRVQISYQLANDWSLRGGFSMNSQPFHVLLQTNGYYENENWILADNTYKPQISNQISGGIFGKIPTTTIELSVEGYYKTMENLLFLNPIAYDNKNMFDYLYKEGKGKSYGSELMLRKNNGKIQWDIAYTLSWSLRKFEAINNNKWFFSEYDRRHYLNIGFHYYSGKKNSWNLNYILQSGRPFTLPSAYVPQTSFFSGFYVINSVNNYRMPAYKRLDISYKRQGAIGRWKTELILSVMNVFARKNPSSMYVKDGNLYMNSLYRVIPSINLKFYIK